MTPESLFSIASTLAASGWALLVFLPRQGWASVTSGVAIPIAFAALYIVLIGSAWTESEGSFSTLAGVAALFGNPWLLLAGWVHYLAFDLLVGNWEARDARARGVPHLLLVPCLLLTFLFGPAGWLLYLGVRRAGHGPAKAGPNV